MKRQYRYYPHRVNYEGKLQYEIQVRTWFRWRTYPGAYQLTLSEAEKLVAELNRFETSTPTPVLTGR